MQVSYAKIKELVPPIPFFQLDKGNPTTVAAGTRGT